LASFVSWLPGTEGYQVKISHPKSLGEALKLAVSLQEAERQQRFNEIFYTRSEKSVPLLSEPKVRPDTGNGNRRYSCETHAYRQARIERQSAPVSKNRADHQENRKMRTEAAVRLYECDGRGHFARECPTRLRKEQKLSDSPCRKNPSERSKLSQAPAEKQGTAISGNECEA